MTASHPLAELISSYVIGALDVPSRQQLEDHLHNCASCRELLEHARAFRAAAASGLRPGDGEHVQAQLLVEYHETPAGLEPDVLDLIRTHLEGCDLCAGALAVLDELPVLADVPAPEARPRDHPGSRPADRPAVKGHPAPARMSGWRAALAPLAVLLRPLPALGLAVLLLVALLPLYLMLRSGPPESGVVALLARPADVVSSALPAAVVLTGETTFRRGPAAAPPPVEVPVAGDGRFAHLELSADIDQDDLADPRARFTVELLEEGRVLFARLVARDEFDDRGRLAVALHVSELERSGTYTLVIRYRKAGDPLDGEALFRRTFRLRRQGP